jgi:hypothetical protein
LGAPGGPRPDSHLSVETKLDSKTVELLAFTIFRSIFRQGIRVPLKLDGVVDLDLMVRDNNVLLNMNEVIMGAPELSIWRLTFAYQGKPVVEYGRGIKNGMKVHYLALSALLVTIWRERRKRNRAMARGTAARDLELSAMALPEATLVATKEPAV